MRSFDPKYLKSSKTVNNYVKLLEGITISPCELTSFQLQTKTTVPRLQEDKKLQPG